MRSVRSVSPKGRRGVQRADEGHVDPPPEALIRRESRLQSGRRGPTDPFPAQGEWSPAHLGTGSGKEQELRFGADGARPPIEQDLRIFLPSGFRRARRSPRPEYRRPFNHSTASPIWVVFPDPSPPSKVTNLPISRPSQSLLTIMMRYPNDLYSPINPASRIDFHEGRFGDFFRAPAPAAKRPPGKLPERLCASFFPAAQRGGAGSKKILSPDGNRFGTPAIP
jgi:hypothetical protein